MIEGIPVGDLGPWGIVAIIVMLVLFGKLAPKSRLDEKDEQIRYWRDAYENERERSDIWAGHAKRVMEGQKLVIEVIESMRAFVMGREGEP